MKKPLLLSLLGIALAGGIFAVLVAPRLATTPAHAEPTPPPGDPVALPYRPVTEPAQAVNPEASGVPYEQLPANVRAAIDADQAAYEARWPEEEAASQAYLHGMKARADAIRARRAAGMEVLP
jgi:hypothetical protein